MMESELLDVSLITTTPFEREVETKMIGKADFPSLLAHIEEEIAQAHQVLIIYPLVEESSEVPYQSLDEARGFWEKRFEDVYVTHGKDREKEEVLLSFREQGKILLATTVVEVGISLPRLTLIVIVGAERLGLATLHQLRGRVGRNGLKSWCYLYSNTTNNARLEQFSQTNNGFDIAKLDLKFRNSGDILDGSIQSGQRFRWLDLGEDEEIAMPKNVWHYSRLSELLEYDLGFIDVGCVTRTTLSKEHVNEIYEKNRVGIRKGCLGGSIESEFTIGSFIHDAHTPFHVIEDIKLLFGILFK